MIQQEFKPWISSRNGNVLNMRRYDPLLHEGVFRHAHFDRLAIDIVGKDNSATLWLQPADNKEKPVSIKSLALVLSSVSVSVMIYIRNSSGLV